MINKSRYVNKDYIFIKGDFEGQETRCTGIFTSENDGITYLELNNGMPVPVDQVELFLKPTKHRHIATDEIDLTELKQQYEPELLKEERVQPVQKTQQVNIQQEQIFAPAQVVEAPKAQAVVDMFGGFSKTPIEIPLKLNMELPDIALIRVMYNNYGNKDEFISNFSNHILASINKDVICSSVLALLENADKPKRTKKNNSPEING